MTSHDIEPQLHEIRTTINNAAAKKIDKIFERLGRDPKDNLWLDLTKELEYDRYLEVNIVAVRSDGSRAYMLTAEKSKGDGSSRMGLDGPLYDCPTDKMLYVLKEIEKVALRKNPTFTEFPKET